MATVPDLVYTSCCDKLVAYCVCKTHLSHTQSGTQRHPVVCPCSSYSMVLFGVGVSNFAPHTPDTLFMTWYGAFQRLLLWDVLFLVVINPCKAGVIGFNNQLTSDQKQTLQCLMQIIPYLKWVPTFSRRLLYYIPLRYIFNFKSSCLPRVLRNCLYTLCSCPSCSNCTGKTEPWYKCVSVFYIST